MGVSDHHATKNIFLLLKNNCLQDYSVFISQYEVLVHLKRRALIWLNPHIRIGGSYKIQGFSLFKQNCNPFLVSCHFAQTFNNHTWKRSHLSGPLRGSPNAFWEDARDRLLRRNMNPKKEPQSKAVCSVLVGLSLEKFLYNWCYSSSARG